MRKNKKLSTSQLHLLASIKYEYLVISKVIAFGIPLLTPLYVCVFINFLNGNRDMMVVELLAVLFVVWLQSIFFLILLQKHKKELNEHLKSKNLV